MGALPSTYDVVGPEGAAPIVFVHGAQVTRKVWLPQIQALASDYRVVALDMPGHGSLAGMRFRLQDAVRQIADVVDKAASGRAIIVGLSLGGYVVMEFAHQHPDKAAGLVLSGCTVDTTSKWRFFFEPFARFLNRFYNAFWVDWIDKLYFRVMYPKAIAKVVLDQGLYRKPVAEAILELRDHRFLPKIAAYPEPVLFVNGQYDFVLRSGEKTFVARCKDSRLTIIQKAIHLSSLDQPEAFTEAVHSFARSIGW
jgi:pimeloyl-ACP methyl ester carboxylesterase